jgi:tetratricopeptide (TPR) repeat protein
MWYASYITEDFNDIRRYCNMMFEAALYSRFLWFDLGVTYRSFLDDYPKAISAFEKVEDLNLQWEDDWKYISYYEEYAGALLMSDRPEEVDRIADIGLKVNPENRLLVVLKGARSIMLNDTVATRKYKDEVRSIFEELGFTQARLEHNYGLMHCWAKDSIIAADYFRRAYEMDRERISSLFKLMECQVRSNINIEECLRLCEYGIEKEPEWTAFLWGKGLSLHKLGRNLEALAILREVEDTFGSTRGFQKDLQEVEQALASQNQ